MVFSAGQGELTAKINADASGFRSGMQSAMQALGGFRGAVGLASGAVVAFAGAKGLGAAVSSAAQFEKHMLSLRSTVGESESAIRSIRGETMNLAEETGEATSEIVDGYRFARSAGLEMAEANELVETATKASAAGFGEQSELVRTATTAINAWSEEVDSGSQFLDTMTAAAQNADIRVSDMANAFRRNVNTASQLNLSLEETLSSLSAISGAVGSASRGGRLFQQTLAGLLKPSNKSAEAISEVYGSVDNLQQAIQDQGLVQTLVDLQDRLEENGQGLDDVFRSTRRLEGALALVSGEGERAKDIMGGLENTTGNVQKAFKNTDGTLREWRKTQQKMNNLLVEMGEDLLPTVNSTLSVASDTMRNFGEATDAANNLWNAFTSGIEDATVREQLRNMAGLSQETVDSFAQLQGVNMNPLDPNRGETIDIDQTRMVATFKALARDIPAEMRDEFAREFESMVVDATRDMETADFSAMLGDLRDMKREFKRRAKAAKVGIQESGIFKDPFSEVGGGGDFFGVFGKKLKDETEESTKEGINDGLSQTDFSKKFAQGFKNSISNQVRPTLEQFQKENAGALFDPFGDPKEQRRMLQELRQEGQQQFQGLSEDARRTLSNNLALAMRDGFKDGSEAADQIMQAMINSMTQRLATNLVDSLGRGMQSMANQGGTTGNIFGSILSGVDMLFGDTPGVMEAEQGGVAAFKPGDKFAAAQNESDLRNMVGSGRGKNTGGDQVNVNETYNINYEIRAVDAQSVQQLFERNGDQIAAQVTDRIRRRSEVQKAVRDAAK